MSKGPRNFRLTLWIFMTFVAGYMVVYTVTHGGELWKIITQGIVLVLGIIFCIMIYSAGKKDN